MLRIVMTEAASEQRWILEGRLAGLWVAELSANWEKTKNSRQERRCVVDLSNVTFMDEKGKELLSEMMKEGARLIGRGVCTRHVLKNLRRKSWQNG